MPDNFSFSSSNPLLSDDRTIDSDRPNDNTPEILEKILSPGNLK